MVGVKIHWDIVPELYSVHKPVFGESVAQKGVNLFGKMFQILKISLMRQNIFEYSKNEIYR